MYAKDSVALGAFLGMAELYAKGLVTPEHFAQQCITIAREYHEKALDGPRNTEA